MVKDSEGKEFASLDHLVYHHAQEIRAATNALVGVFRPEQVLSEIEAPEGFDQLHFWEMYERELERGMELGLNDALEGALEQGDLNRFCVGEDDWL